MIPLTDQAIANRATSSQARLSHGLTRSRNTRGGRAVAPHRWELFCSWLTHSESRVCLVWSSLILTLTLMTVTTVFLIVSTSGIHQHHLQNWTANAASAAHLEYVQSSNYP